MDILGLYPSAVLVGRFFDTLQIILVILQVLKILKGNPALRIVGYGLDQGFLAGDIIDQIQSEAEHISRQFSSDQLLLCIKLDFTFRTVSVLNRQVVFSIILRRHIQRTVLLVNNCHNNIVRCCIVGDGLYAVIRFSNRVVVCARPGISDGSEVHNQ